VKFGCELGSSKTLDWIFMNLLEQLYGLDSGYLYGNRKNRT